MKRVDKKVDDLKYVLESLESILHDTPVILGFSDLNHVASYIGSSRHSILLDGYLLYAYRSDNTIKSLVITSYTYGKFMVSVVYSNYDMIYCGLRYDKLDEFIESFKSYDDVYKSLSNRFYDNSGGI